MQTTTQQRVLTPAESLANFERYAAQGLPPKTVRAQVAGALDGGGVLRRAVPDLPTTIDQWTDCFKAATERLAGDPVSAAMWFTGPTGQALMTGFHAAVSVGLEQTGRLSREAETKSDDVAGCLVVSPALTAAVDATTTRQAYAKGLVKMARAANTFADSGIRAQIRAIDCMRALMSDIRNIR